MPLQQTKSFGGYAYALAAIFLGSLGLISQDFATTWQRVSPNIPHHATLATIVALAELLAGAALLWSRTARTAALTLTILYSVFALLWVPQIFASPFNYGGAGNFFEEFSLVIAGLVLYATYAPPDSRWSDKSAQISRLFGLCALSFALVHLVNLPATTTYVPRWIPPGQMFWAITTTICFLCAAAAILSGILAGLAARLLTAMVIGFGLLLWLPILIATPHSHFSWSANAINFAIAASSWVTADALSN